MIWPFGNLTSGGRVERSWLERNCADRLDRAVDPSPVRPSTCLALQWGLGICPQRRRGIGLARVARPSADRPHL